MPSEYLVDLIDHKKRVAAFMLQVANELTERALLHDNSKFSPEEYEMYETAFPALQQHAYGTEDFKAELAKIQPAISHHYQVNDHHPEHFAQGIKEMDLMQIIEMICDWLAASARSKTPLFKSLEINYKRFAIDDQLANIVNNTVENLR